MGVGPNKTQFMKHIKHFSGRLIGIEPDHSVTRVQGLHDQVQNTTFEACDIEPESIDVAYSHFVMEHVEDPDEFLKKLHSVLKPNGTYIFITPNSRSYFVKYAKLFNAFRLDEWYLRLAKGRKAVDEYHYPVIYKFNDVNSISKIARKYGFTSEFAYYERGGAPAYFPRGMKFVVKLLNWRRRLSTNPEILLNLVVRMKKRAID